MTDWPLAAVTDGLIALLCALAVAAARRHYRVKLQRECQHLHANGVYGDAINANGGRRGYCPDCQMRLASIPYSIGAGVDTAHRILIIE